MNEEYAKEDFQKMQQQAIDRVREMQKKAINDQPKPQNQQRPSRFFPQNERRPDRPPFQGQQKGQNPHQEQKITEDRRNEAESEKHVNTKEENEQPKNQLFSSLNPLSSLLNMDTDMSLILPLVMLLGKDGADDMLILALLYIMT
ncbi:MAG: hypothetical protein ACI4SB_06140 [Acutalibacteraceae bacterium]